jgi:hypothetical protein
LGKARLKAFGLIVLLLAAGLLQFGWVLWPEIGFWYGLVNCTVLGLILIVGGIARYQRR